MVLEAVEGLHVFLGPPRIQIAVAPHLGIVLPILWVPGFLNLGILLLAVALFGDHDERGFGDVPVLRLEPAASKRLVEPREEPVEDAESMEFRAEAPERVRLGNRVGERESTQCGKSKPCAHWNSADSSQNW